MDGEPPDLGLFGGVGCGTDVRGHTVIRGPAHDALLAAEEMVARDALARHCANEVCLLSAADWLGRAASRHLKAGRAAVGRSYAALMREAIELMISLGHDLAAVKGRLQDGGRNLERLYPTWLEKARASLSAQFRLLVHGFEERSCDGFLPFDEPLIGKLIQWLEDQGLFAAHMSLQALAEYGLREDRDANVGVAIHVASLAAWVEHVCNAALGPGWSGGNSLHHKLQGCWASHSMSRPFRQVFSSMPVPTNTPFSKAIELVLGTSADDRIRWMARDARLACIIRNTGLHQGLSDLSRREMQDAACILLRTAMGAWLATLPACPPQSGKS